MRAISSQYSARAISSRSVSRSGGSDRPAWTSPVGGSRSADGALRSSSVGSVIGSSCEGFARVDTGECRAVAVVVEGEAGRDGALRRARAATRITVARPPGRWRHRGPGLVGGADHRVDDGVDVDAPAERQHSNPGRGPPPGVARRGRVTRRRSAATPTSAHARARCQRPRQPVQSLALLTLGAHVRAGPRHPRPPDHRRDPAPGDHDLPGRQVRDLRRGRVPAPCAPSGRRPGRAGRWW